MYILKKITALGLLLWSAAVFSESTPSRNKQNLSPLEIARIIKKATNLNQLEIDKLIGTLEPKFGTDEQGKLKISGVLTSKRFNYSMIKDRKFWYFDASFIPEGSNTSVHVPKLYKTEFFNGGIKSELGYKWVFLFVPSNLDVEALDGSTFGRGLGGMIPFSFSLTPFSKKFMQDIPEDVNGNLDLTAISAEKRSSIIRLFWLGFLINFIGIGGGWMPGNELPGNMFFISIMVGLSGGFSFPKMKFELNPEITR